VLYKISKDEKKKWVALYQCTNQGKPMIVEKEISSDISFF